MGVGENNINNMDVYLSRMQKSMLDKIFFIDKVFEPIEYIVDFGCADGSLIRSLKEVCPEYQYVGYDLDPDMIERAKANVPDVSFVNSLADIQVPVERSLLNISSTIHEVYSYGTQASVTEFWTWVFQSGFRYVCIRDMMPSVNMYRTVDAEMLQAVRAKASECPELDQHLRSFEGVWGEIRSQIQLVHFLLKYKYSENWTREVCENYFPLTKGQLLRYVPQSYQIRYCDHRTLPYLAWQVRKDFGFELTDQTHIKLILERKELC